MHFIVQGRDVWLGWRSTDEQKEALFKWLGVLVSANTKASLLEQCSAAQDGLSFDEPVVFDLDRLLTALVARKAVCADDVINCWNMLIDVRASFGPGLGMSFDLGEQSFKDSYDHFFASASGGEMIDFGVYEIGDSDVDIAVEIVSNGMAMLLEIAKGQAGHRSDFGR
ncbi:hypothetical protein [Pseudomonas sp. CGJS7]|uniref:hypothetical protein n=1 Tax=Pseudomonas sp. CGJS7 TaxID=3109348 RepID=UPI00300AFF01